MSQWNSNNECVFGPMTAEDFLNNSISCYVPGEDRLR